MVTESMSNKNQIWVGSWEFFIIILEEGIKARRNVVCEGSKLIFSFVFSNNPDMFTTVLSVVDHVSHMWLSLQFHPFKGHGQFPPSLRVSQAFVEDTPQPYSIPSKILPFCSSLISCHEFAESFWTFIMTDLNHDLSVATAWVWILFWSLTVWIWVNWINFLYFYFPVCKSERIIILTPGVVWGLSKI